jgi:hypothetical protein
LLVDAGELVVPRMTSAGAAAAALRVARQHGPHIG